MSSAEGSGYGQRTARQWAQEAVESTIEGSIGTVVVDGFGQLSEVNLNSRSTLYMDASKLSPRILRAIQQAEIKADERRENSKFSGDAMKVASRERRRYT